MPDTKSCLWLAMPPTALLSLASLFTYLAFRLMYLATARNVTGNSQDEGASSIQLRTLALPWIFFGLELIILCMSTRSRRIVTRHQHTDVDSTKRAAIPDPDPSHQAGHPRKATSSRRRCPKRGRTHHDMQRGLASCHGHRQGCMRSRLPSGPISSLRL